jgi:osmoprotectant transport system ATP-binding protein
MSLITKNLCFSYGDKEVLTDITMNVEPGDLVALMGLSGSGKTTLLRLFLGLNQLNQGELSLDGVNYKNQLATIRDKISYIPQHGALYPHMTIRENITLPLKTKRKVTKDDHLKIQELASTCNISIDLFKRYPHELSGGQRQRISVLRALMMDTPYIFLDEALSALDPITKVNMQKEFKSIFQEKHKTIIMVTHNLNEAKYLCDKIAMLENGRLVQFAKTQELIASPANEFVRSFVQAQV